jgi:hypothetical protein
MDVVLGLYGFVYNEYVTYTLGAVGGFRKWSCEDLKIKKYLRQNGNTGTLQAVAWV